MINLLRRTMHTMLNQNLNVGWGYKYHNCSDYTSISYTVSRLFKRYVLPWRGIVIYNVLPLSSSPFIWHSAESWLPARQVWNAARWCSGILINTCSSSADCVYACKYNMRRFETWVVEINNAKHLPRAPEYVSVGLECVCEWRCGERERV